MYNWKPLSYESYCDAELGSILLSKHKDNLFLVVIKKDWTVSNKETTYDPSLKGPTVVPGRDKASCRLTDARKVPNLIKLVRFFANVNTIVFHSSDCFEEDSWSVSSLILLLGRAAWLRQGDLITHFVWLSGFFFSNFEKVDLSFFFNFLLKSRQGH